MDPQKPTSPVKNPTEDNLPETPDTDHVLPDPLTTPELPEETEKEDEVREESSA